MSISPSQILPQLAYPEITRARTASPPPVPAEAKTATHPATINPLADPLLPAASFSTDLQIDNHHQLFYEFLAGGTGNVDFEIPPEALRDIAESMNLPSGRDGSIPTIDIKS